MSELINNLNSIYNTKLQIKEVIGTSSDNFSEYPTLIDEAISSGAAVLDTLNVSANGTYTPSDVDGWDEVIVNVSGETIAQKNVAWQTKWAPALAQVAAGLYAQDPTYGEPQITDPSGWCVQTALDGNGAMSEMVAMDCLWIEIYNGQSILHNQYVQIFTQMGLTFDSDTGNLVSTDDDKILPFDADEALVTNLIGLNGFGTAGGKRISSLNGNVINSKWNYYGLVFNGTGFDYVYLGQFDYVINQQAMLQKMDEDGVTFINQIPVVSQSVLFNYLNDFQMDGTVNPSGSLSITSNNTYDVTDKASVVVNVPTGGIVPSGTYLFDIDPVNFESPTTVNVSSYENISIDFGDVSNVTINSNGVHSVASLGYAAINGNITVNVPTSSAVDYTFLADPADVSSGSIDVNSYYLFVGTVNQSMDVDSEISQAVPEASIGDHILTLDSNAHAVVIIPSQIIDSRTWASGDKVLVKGECVSTTSVWSGNMYTADEVDNITI